MATAKLVVTLRTTTNVIGIVPQTVVALPPSDLDPEPDEMRVYVNGVLTSRAYDPEMEQP